MKPAVLAAALVLGVAAGRGWARSDEIPWGRAQGEACASCHFMSKPVVQSPALQLQGLPATLEPGQAYRLAVSLAAPGIVRAGFLIVAQAPGGNAGAFATLDERTEADGDRLRSTRAGSTPTAAGAAAWAFIWRAPLEISGPISFSISANASDDDQSPLGDTIHLLHRALCTTACQADVMLRNRSPALSPRWPGRPAFRIAVPFPVP